MRQEIYLPPGRPATAVTLRVMAMLVRHAGTSEAARYRALEIVRSLHAMDDVDYAQDVENFARDNVMLVNEPEEVVIHPLRMLEDIDHGRAAGDCDDMAVLAGTLLYALGIVRLRFKAVCLHPEGYYRHVFLEWRLGDNELWRYLDPTIDGAPIYDGDFITEEV